MTDIHSTAVISKGAQLGADVSVGAYSVIGPHVRIGDGTSVGPHVVLDGHTTIGSECGIFPFACLGSRSQDLKFKGATTYVEIGDKTILREYVTVNAGTGEGEVTRVGKACFLMAYCHVAHACKVGDGVIMANCATLAGEVTVEEGAVLGGLSAVHQFCRIGAMTMVGGCTKIVKDCPPFMMVDGNPAVVRGLNLIGLKRRDVCSEAIRALRESYRLLYRSDLTTTQAVEKIAAEYSGHDKVQQLLDFISSSKRGITK